jgi:hypothetical protein
MTMEDLFAPTTRFRDLYRAARDRSDGDGDVYDFFTDRDMNLLVELELITGSSAEDILLRLLLVWSRKDRVAKPRRSFQFQLD